MSMIALAQMSITPKLIQTVKKLIELIRKRIWEISNQAQFMIVKTS